MYPSDLVKLKHGPAIWMTVEMVHDSGSKVSTVWLDSDGKLRRSPVFPQQALEKRKDEDTPPGWAWPAQEYAPHRHPIREGRNARLITYPYPSDEEAIEMTVTGAIDRLVRVVWFDKKGDLNEATLPVELLYFRKES